MLGRGRFARVVVSEKNESKALKIIETDDQRPPHDWKGEIAALELLQNTSHIVPMLHWSSNLQSMDPEVRIEMPRYAMTLEHVIYHYAKANYPPGSGWRNVMPASRINSIISGIAAGLDAVHEKGIIHRDLKPENVMFMNAESEPVLIDFGIAWVPGVSDHKEPSGDRITDVSTAEYKAPELLFGIRRYNEKIDIWALGCILGQLLSKDCTPLFSPYTSDMALIAAQVRELGAPILSECPSLIGSIAEQLPGPKPTVNEPLKQSFRKIQDDPILAKLIMNLLQYEWTSRPTARDVIVQLGDSHR